MRSESALKKLIGLTGPPLAIVNTRERMISTCYDVDVRLIGCRLHELEELEIARFFVIRRQPATKRMLAQIASFGDGMVPRSQDHLCQDKRLIDVGQSPVMPIALTDHCSGRRLGPLDNLLRRLRSPNLLRRSNRLAP